MFDVDVLDTRDELDRKPAWQRIQSRRVAALDLGSNSFQTPCLPARWHCA